jgi:hypothetical protein
MKKSDKKKLDRILSNNPDISVQEKRSILGQVVQSTKENAHSHRLARFWLPIMSASLAALVAMVLWFSAPEQSAEFVAKGENQTPTSNSFKLACAAGDIKPLDFKKNPQCRINDSLYFKIESSSKLDYFSAAALGPEGLLVWYFPAENTTSLAISSQGLAEKSIVIGSEHVKGSYRLLGIFSKKALNKEQLRKQIEAYLAGQPTHLTIQERSIEVIQP